MTEVYFLRPRLRYSLKTLFLLMMFACCASCCASITWYENIHRPEGVGWQLGIGRLNVGSVDLAKDSRGRISGVFWRHYRPAGKTSWIIEDRALLTVETGE